MEDEFERNWAYRDTLEELSTAIEEESRRYPAVLEDD